VDSVLSLSVMMPIASPNSARMSRSQSSQRSRLRGPYSIPRSRKRSLRGLKSTAPGCRRLLQNSQGDARRRIVQIALRRVSRLVAHSPA
jgi:hypothetical protein